jgi:hypothetical protein
MLSIFKTTAVSRFSNSKLSKKRSSKEMLAKTKHDTDTDQDQTYVHQLGNSRKGSLKSHGSNGLDESIESPKKKIFGSPKQSILPRSTSFQKNQRSYTKATISEPVSHVSSNNWLNPIVNEKQEEM